MTVDFDVFLKFLTDQGQSDTSLKVLALSFSGVYNSDWLLGLLDWRVRRSIVQHKKIKDFIFKIHPEQNTVSSKMTFIIFSDLISRLFINMPSNSKNLKIAICYHD